MRLNSLLVLGAAIAFACGGSTSSTSNQPDTSGGSGGGGGTAGSDTGGSSGTSGAGGGGGNACAPMPGCTSRTICNDGCNTCACSNGQWFCTQRACPPEDAGRSDAGLGACETDQDCVFRPQSGCCGACIAQNDPIPPRVPCGATCSIIVPSCVCINHTCGTGTVQAGGSCDPAHSLCSYGLLCCSHCGGPYVPDAQSCRPPVCTQPVVTQDQAGCPPPAQ